MKTIHYLGIALIVALLAALVVDAGTMNGFNITENDLIAPADIHSGGPPRDGIPSLDKPRFLDPAEARMMKPKDPILGLAHKGVAKAYPISVMNWHEIVNDRFAQEPVVVTYCPLCGSGIAYSASVAGMEVSFGVSGLLYNSDVLLFDRQTESLWSQMMAQAVSGPLRGTRLDMLPLTLTTWSDWLAEHPNTLVLSRDTGFNRDYDSDPYAGYEDSEGVWFPVQRKDPRYHPKERVLGLELNGQFKAYPIAELSRHEGSVRDHFAGRDLIVEYRPESDSARVLGADGEQIPAVNSFWFAWYAFHPHTEVFRAARTKAPKSQ